MATLPAGVDEGAVRLPWRLFAPAAAAKERPLPLILFLHGAGTRGDDNVRPMVLAYPFISPEAQAKNPCFVLAPQVAGSAGANKERRWVNTDWAKGSYDAKKVAISDEMKQALALVDRLLAERPIDRQRVYVVGQSMGGFGTWDAMLRRPELFAAGLPLCGGGDPSQAAALAAIPIWTFHGTKDPVVPPRGTEEMAAALGKLSKVFTYTPIEGAGHTIWSDVYAREDVHTWLFAQRKATR